MLNTKSLLVLAMAGMLGLSTTSQSMAAPVVSNGGAVKAAAAADTINVQWRGRGWRGGWRGGWGPGLGFGLGLGLAGAALAAPYYGAGYGYGGYGYCGPYGACGGPYYGSAYGPAVVVVPGYGYGAPYYGGWQGGW
jgi:hypothetical protein